MILQSLTESLVLGILLIFKCCSSGIYFIKSENSTCTVAQPCLTLNEFAINISADEHIQAEVSAGNHILSAQLDFHDIINFSMLSVKSNGTKVTCNQSAGLRFHNVSMVTIANLAFIGCGNNYTFLRISQIKITISSCIFLSSRGKIIGATKSNITMTDCKFENSCIEWLTTEYSTAIGDTKSSYAQNHKSEKITEIIDIHESEVMFENLLYHNNSGSILIGHSKAKIVKGIFQSNKQTGYPDRGAITSIASIIRFCGNTTFRDHDAWHAGGAILATESRVYACDDICFSNNKAKKRESLGGALYLYHSSFICQTNCTFIGNKASKGGAIFAINSVITIGYDWNKFNDYNGRNINISLSFISNSADIGGGIYLESSSKLRTPREEDSNYVLEFENNTALTGGTIFVNDHTNTLICKEENYGTCFIQVPSFASNWHNGLIKINSTSGNTTIFGGLLDRCITKHRYTDLEQITGIDYMKRVTEYNDAMLEDMISSDPVRVCYCYNNKVDCNYTHPTINIERGETIQVPIAAVDQMNHIVSASIITKSTHSYTHHLGIRQEFQKIHNGVCSNLTLNVFSPNDSIELIMYAKGPCQDFGRSKIVLYIKFTPCTCPIGFQQQTNKGEACICDCDPKLKPYITNCSQSSKSIQKQGDFWLNYINTTGSIEYIFFHCPFDYCLPSTENVSINLNVPDGEDAQCAFNRTGLLCSSCRSGLSLSIGSSLCLSCPKDWPKMFIAIALGAIVSGIALITVILILNLTTAVGTLSGLIFYVNIMAANNIIYSSSSEPNMFSVFIAWLNLELGLDTCFYNGLDSYTKVWLQFVFPVYLICILIMVILTSKYSSRFAKLIGKRNPIATLATVILLSYMKILRNIIDIFSVANLKYPDGSHHIQWLSDANIEYLQGKHIPLFLIAVVIVSIGLIYTVLLLTWQWLLQAPNCKLLGWIRNTRLNLFMEANVAAYNSKYRYWTGLLLLTRVALYLEIAFNTSDQTSSSLAATGLVCACLLFIKALSRSNVYKKKLIDYLNSFCYLNLLILSVALLHYHDNRTGKITAAQVSVSVAFVQLLCMLIYHTVITLLEIPYITQIKQRLQKHPKLVRILPFSSQGTENMMQTVTICSAPTSTEVGLSDSEETSLAEHKEEYDMGRVQQILLTTTWKMNSLREPLLHDEL